VIAEHVAADEVADDQQPVAFDLELLLAAYGSRTTTLSRTLSR